MKKQIIDKTTGEIQEEINHRVEHRLNQEVLFRRPFHRHSVKTEFSEPSMTHQAHKESCDINTIIRQFDRTGVLPPAAHLPQYADVSDLNRDLTELISDSKSTLQQYKSDLAAYQAAEQVRKATPSPQNTDNNPTPVPPPAPAESP